MTDDNVNVEVPTPTKTEMREAVLPAVVVPKPVIKIKMTKEEHERIKAELAAEKGLPPKKPFKFPWAKRSILNKSLKRPEDIVVFLINLKKQLEGPLLTKIYGGNFLVIRNHVYRFNPSRVYSMGKYKVVIAREFDRELVGIEDYQELVLRDYLSKNPGARTNVDDPVLIKAIIAARLAEKPPMVANNKLIIIGVVIVGLAVGAFLLFGGKKATTTTTVVTPPTSAG